MNTIFNTFSDFDICPICSKGMIESLVTFELECFYCQQQSFSTIKCSNGHYICDLCIGTTAKHIIITHCKKSNSIDLFLLANDLMKHPNFPISGSEHHLLIPAVLLTAYANSIQDDVLKEQLIYEAEIRTFDLFLQNCCHYGSCVGGISVGIFFKILSDLKLLNPDDFKICNNITAQTLIAIADNSPSICCKRCVFISLEKAVDSLRESLNISLLTKQKTVCTFHNEVKSCNQEECQFYPNQTY